MCGRYGVIPDKDFGEYFDTENRGETKYRATYNASPGSTNPIITMNSPKHLHLAHWGFLPVWAKDTKLAFSTFNARSEGLEESRMFGNAYKKHRCLIPVSHYYEFAHLKDEPKTKQPYLFKLKHEKYFALAGLYSEWHDPKEDKDMYTYTIVTTQTNADGAKVHTRMPVIIDKKDWEEWMDNAHFDTVTLKGLMKPFADKDMEMWAVSRELGNSRNNYPELIEKQSEVPITPSKPAWEEKKAKKNSK